VFEYAIEVLQAQINFNETYLNTNGKNTDALSPLKEELQQAISLLQKQKGEEE